MQRPFTTPTPDLRPKPISRTQNRNALAGTRANPRNRKALKMPEAIVPTTREMRRFLTGFHADYPVTELERMAINGLPIEVDGDALRTVA
jgi:hypothetical protein